MPFVKVSAGGPPPDQDVPDGVHPVTLVRISDVKTVTAQRGQNAGKEIDLIDWDFAIDDGGPHDGRIVQSSTSTASGPRSKMFSWLTALLGGKPPAVGQTFEHEDLLGRRALATISHDEFGWPRIENLGAMPASMLGAKLVAATGMPVREDQATAALRADTPLREQVAAGEPEKPLPF